MPGRGNGEPGLRATEEREGISLKSLDFLNLCNVKTPSTGKKNPERRGAGERRREREANLGLSPFTLRACDVGVLQRSDWCGPCS